MITLVTGSPGAGKTLWMVKEIFETLIPTGRTIYTNINGLNIPDAPNVKECDTNTPFDWFNYEDGAVFVFDEVQKQYPARHATSKMPKYIEEYQTHRHKGMDFYFITQGPKLIDRALHDLTERHVHLFRAFGMQRSKVSEYGAVNDTPQPPQTYASALKKNFSFPKKYFDFYRSASQHTVQRKLPWHIIAPALVFVAIALAFVSYVVYSITSGFGATDHAVSQPAPVDRLKPAPACDFTILARTDAGLTVRHAGNVLSVPNFLVIQNGQAYYEDTLNGKCHYVR